MIYFTKYAEQKFEILNKYKVFFTKEQIEDCIKNPDKTGKKDEYLSAEKEGIKTLYAQDGELNKIITFYPVK